jgi:uncharacterized protein YyaL (SSP411 family)
VRSMTKGYKGILPGITAFVMTCWLAHAELPRSSAELGGPTARTDRCLAHLETTYVRGLDLERYGLVGDRKYLDIATLERALAFSRPSSDGIPKWAKGTLHAHTQLVDPVLGGAYEYSLGGDWNHPCYTKTLAGQNAAIVLYAGAYRTQGILEYLSVAERSVDYVEKFLKAGSGSYFTSRGSCARETDRGAQGVGSDGDHDQNRHTLVKDERVLVAENADFVRALAELYAVSTRERFKELALQSARRLRARDGEPKHKVIDIRGISATHDVLDKVAIGRALFSLYSITGDSRWLHDSVVLLDKLISDHGPFSRSLKEHLALSSRIEVATSLSRLSNMIYLSTGDARYREEAKRALESALSARCDEASVVDAARLLLADEELRTEPPHAVLVGDGNDGSGEDLWRVILSKLPSYARRERFSSVSALRQDTDMRYPRLSRPAAFLCVKKRCSVPIFTATELTERIAEMMADRIGVSDENR